MDTMNGKVIKEGYTFDDLLLVPAYSQVVPADVQLKTRLCDGILLSIPVCSAAMDTVTESKMGIALAQAGGLGFIHKNLSSELQAEMVKEVKAAAVLSNSAVDARGKLLAGAAVGVSEGTMARVQLLVEAGVDIITVDSAHGHSAGVIETVRKIHEKYPNLPLVGGNIVTGDAAQALIQAGASVLKVGVGPGSICTTRIVSGVGVPQLTAVSDVVQVAKRYNVGVIADGGIKFSGDIVKALVVGAHSVMIGSLFAGTEESPGETILYQGRTYKIYRGMGSIDAMKDGSSDRYFQEKSKKLVPEGIVGRVPYRGPVMEAVYQLMGGLRSGMGYVGAHNLTHLYENTTFCEISPAGLRESHVHDVVITKEAPNYRIEN